MKWMALILVLVGSCARWASAEEVLGAQTVPAVLQQPLVELRPPTALCLWAAVSSPAVVAPVAVGAGQREPGTAPGCAAVLTVRSKRR